MMSSLTVSVTPLQVRIDGLTGHIQFNEKGRRTNFTVSVMELAPSGPKKVGYWNEDEKYVTTASFVRGSNETYGLQNRTYIVTTILVSNTERDEGSWGRAELISYRVQDVLRVYSQRMLRICGGLGGNGVSRTPGGNVFYLWNHCHRGVFVTSCSSIQVSQSNVCAASVLHWEG
ncbi:Glutamate receptor 1 [Liparis tanakae]|uniref:Glutamate receptor 1 n=1 Tax=Liparis tanakae TaxID=230148 RepID=A0A4Z2ECN1_9TELE|nr:Glutamate receptor 1 [Liparis tanakae]